VRTYLLKRLLLVPVTLLGITMITFGIIQLAPGDPAKMKVSPGVGGQQQANKSINRETYERTLEQFDLDKPLPLRYLRWVGRLCGVEVQVEGAKQLYKARVDALLLERYREANGEAIERRRGSIERRLEADGLADPGPRGQEVERQLAEWTQSQAQKQRFRHSEAIEAIRGEFVGRYGEEFKREFWYTGLAWNLTPSGRWYPLDFGRSFKDDRPVWDWIWERLPVSIELALVSIFFAYVIAIPLGVHSATHQGTFLDALVTTVLFVLYSLPSFWVAIMLLLYVSKGGVGLHWFPVQGLSGDPSSYPEWIAAAPTFLQAFLDHLWHLVLPITCLTYGSFAYISRQMRAGMLEVIRQDYIRTARAKGLSERVVVFKHALRNSLIPIITIVAFVLPAMVGGSVIIETIFSIDGLGRLSFQAILTRDYPIIMAIFTLSALLTLIGILLSDLLYAVVNPQMTFEGR